MTDPSAHVGAFDLTDPAGDDHDGPGYYADDDGPELGAPTEAPGSPLADLERELLVDLGDGHTRLEVDGRPGWVAVYRRDFTGEDLERFRKRAKKGKRVDPIHFGAILIAATMVRLEKGGAPVEDPDLADGTPLTVRSSYLSTLYGTPSAAETARRFFGTDGYVNAQCEGILEAAGWGDEAVDADPS